MIVNLQPLTINDAEYVILQELIDTYLFQVFEQYRDVIDRVQTNLLNRTTLNKADVDEVLGDSTQFISLMQNNLAKPFEEYKQTFREWCEQKWQPKHL